MSIRSRIVYAYRQGAQFDGDTYRQQPPERSNGYSSGDSPPGITGTGPSEGPPASRRSAESSTKADYLCGGEVCDAAG